MCQQVEPQSYHYWHDPAIPRTRVTRNSGNSTVPVPLFVPPGRLAIAAFAGSRGPARAAAVGEGGRPPRSVGRRPTGAPTISTRWPAYFLTTAPNRYFVPVPVSANVNVPGAVM